MQPIGGLGVCLPGGKAFCYLRIARYQHLGSFRRRRLAEPAQMVFDESSGELGFDISVIPAVTKNGGLCTVPITSSPSSLSRNIGLPDDATDNVRNGMAAMTVAIFAFGPSRFAFVALQSVSHTPAMAMVD